MIIHVCGTMGSGKTTLIRAFMASRQWEPVPMAGRKYPVGYTSGQIFVAGVYNDGLQTSGCDALKNDLDTPQTYGLVREWHERGYHVIYEGLYMMNHTRGLALWNDTRALHVLRLTTPVEVCRQGVLERRAVKGNTEPPPPRLDKGLVDNNKRAQSYTFKLRQVGCPVYPVSRENALDKINELLEMKHAQ